MVHVAKQTAAAHVSGLCRWIHVDSTHHAQVDHQAAIAGRFAGKAVSPTFDRQQQSFGSCEVDRAPDVRTADALCNEGGVFVDRRINYAAGIVVCRLAYHVPNFTPVAAVAMFGGFLFARRSVALLAPLAAMLISDLFIGFSDVLITLTVYASILLYPLVMRRFLRQRFSALRVGLCAGSCSLVFFATTNLAVWVVRSEVYARSFEGLLHCYTTALPFLRPTLTGDLLFSAVLFGAYALVTNMHRLPQGETAGVRSGIA